MSGITGAQIRKLHSLKSALGLQEDEYRAALQRFDVVSCKDLSGRQAGILLDEWESRAAETGVWKLRAVTSLRHAGKRPEKGASGRQLRMVEAMWAQVSRAESFDEQRSGLQKFVKRIVKRDKLEWCTHKDIGALVKTLQAMGARRV